MTRVAIVGRHRYFCPRRGSTFGNGLCACQLNIICTNTTAGTVGVRHG
jgi:hypothetical protein